MPLFQISATNMILSHDDILRRLQDRRELGDLPESDSDSASSSAYETDSSSDFEEDRSNIQQNSADIPILLFLGYFTITIFAVLLFYNFVLY